MKKIISTLIEAKRRVGELEAELAKAKEIESLAELQIIDALDTLELTSAKDEDGNLCFIRRTIFANTNREDFPEVKAWLEEQDMASYAIEETIRRKVLNDKVKEMLKDGDKIPEFIKIWVRTGITLRKGKKK